MSEDKNLKENFENINKNVEYDIDMQKLKKELQKRFSDYQKTMKFMTADAPISILCLPSSTQKVLLNSGLLRIYDLFDVDLIKIEGLNEARISDLTTRLDQFFSML